MKIRGKHFTDETTRRERAKHRATNRVIVERAVRLQELGERRARAIELDGRDEPLRDVNAMRASAIFGELECSARASAVERAEQIAERRRAKSTGELHAFTANESRAGGPSLWSHQGRSHQGRVRGGGHIKAAYAAGMGSLADDERSGDFAVPRFACILHTYDRANANRDVAASTRACGEREFPTPAIARLIDRVFGCESSAKWRGEWRRRNDDDVRPRDRAIRLRDGVHGAAHATRSLRCGTAQHDVDVGIACVVRAHVAARHQNESGHREAHAATIRRKKMRPLLFVLFVLAMGCAAPTVVGRAPLAGGGSVDIVQIPLRLSNAFMIRTARPILVDSGTIGDMEDLDNALAERGVSVSAVKLIVVTHGHADHAGLAADIQKLSHAKVILGAGDVPLAAAGHNDNLKPTGLTGAILKPFITSEYPELTPDIVVRPGVDVDLAPWGISGKVVAMPGHTPGSIVVLLDDHTAFVGDMIAGGSLGGIFFPHSPGEHLYQADPEQNRKNIQTLIDRGVAKFYVGHGGPVTRKDVIAAFGLRGP